MPRVELELEEEIEISVDETSSLSNDFYLDDAFEIDIEVDKPEVTNFYPSDNEHSNYLEPEVSSDNSNVKIIKSRKPNLFVDVLDKVPAEQYQKAINEGIALTTTKLTNSLQEISTKLKFNDNVYLGNQLETLLRSSDKSGGSIKDGIIYEMYMNKNITSKELFYKMNPNSNNEAEFLVFDKQFNDIKNVIKQEQDKNNHLASMNKKSSQILLVKLLDLNLIDRLYSYNKEFKYVRKFYTKNGLVSHFKCECCSTEEEDSKQPIENFIHIINIAGKDFSTVLPLECKACGTFHLLDNDVLKSVISKCATISGKLKTTRVLSNKIGNHNRSIMNIGVYNPSLDEMTSFLKKYNMEFLDDEEEIEIDLDGDSTENVISSSNLTLDEVDSDWENIKRRFFETISVIGDSKFKLSFNESSNSVENSDSEFNLNDELSDELNANLGNGLDDYLGSHLGGSDSTSKPRSVATGITNSITTNGFNRGRDLHLKNVTKIYSTMNGNYPYLKNMAMASAINLLKPLGLSRYSLTSKSFYRVYSLFDNLENLGKKELEFISEDLGFRIYNSDGSLNKDISTVLFDDICYMNKNFEQEKQKFIKSLYDNLYFLSYMPISSDKILDEDVNDYLYDDEIKSFLDRVSDLMILNSISEEWLSRFNPALKNGVESNMLINSKRTVMDSVKAMRSVGRKKTLWELLTRVSVYVTSKPIESILHFVDSVDSINYLNNFLEACYKKDLYEMYRSFNKINGNFSMPAFKELHSLFELITMFNCKTIESDKFSFYFPNLECDNKFKPRFVKVFEKKGFVPRHLEGNTEEEMLNYYESLDSCEDVINYLPKDVEQLLASYKDVIKFGRFISYSSLYKDFGVYYASRDLLYSVAINDVPMDEILQSLNLSPELASMLLEDDYEFPKVDELVVEYIDLVNLPLDDSLDVPSGTYRDRIIYLLENYDDVKPVFSKFPKVYDLVLKMIGENENSNEDKGNDN